MNTEMTAGVGAEGVGEGTGGIGSMGGSFGGMELSQVIGFLNVVAGLVLVASFLLFFGGLVAYLTRLGLPGREQGLTFMAWGVVALFSLVLILAIKDFVQDHTQVVFTLLAVVIIGVIGYVAIQIARGSGEEDDKKH